jgi:hypothetical protein
VQRSVAIDGGSADAIEGLRVTDIRRYGQDVAPQAGQPGRMFGEVLLVDVGHDDPHAFGDERLDDRQSDPTRRAGHDRHTPGKLVHR